MCQLCWSHQPVSIGHTLKIGGLCQVLRFDFLSFGDLRASRVLCYHGILSCSSCGRFVVAILIFLIVVVPTEWFGHLVQAKHPTFVRKSSPHWTAEKHASQPWRSVRRSRLPFGFHCRNLDRERGDSLGTESHWYCKGQTKEAVHPKSHEISPSIWAPHHRCCTSSLTDLWSCWFEFECNFL